MITFTLTFRDGRYFVSQPGLPDRVEVCIVTPELSALVEAAKAHTVAQHAFEAVDRDSPAYSATFITADKAESKLLMTAMEFGAQP